MVLARTEVVLVGHGTERCVSSCVHVVWMKPDFTIRSYSFVGWAWWLHLATLCCGYVAVEVGTNIFVYPFIARKVRGHVSMTVGAPFLQQRKATWF